MSKLRIFTIALLALGMQPCLAQSGDCGGVGLPEAPAAATVSAVDTGPAFQYAMLEPRVVNWKRVEPVRLKVVVTGNPSEVDFLPIGGGPEVPLDLILPDIYGILVSPDVLLDGYKPGTLHNVAGRILIRDGAQVIPGGNLSVNVRDGGVHDVPINSLGPDVQAGPHVVNIRFDTPWLGAQESYPVDALYRFYQFYGDDFDFIVLVSNVEAIGHHIYEWGISNGVAGIGLPLYSRAAQYGSAGRLQATVNITVSNFFDLATWTMLHEIGHRWINFLSQVPDLAPGIPHWPISTLAYGIIGWDQPGTGGLQFPYRLTELDNGDYQLDPIKPADECNDFELYLMGLIPPESVADGIVLVNQDQGDRVHPGGILQGPAVVVSARDIINYAGPRIPAAGSSQTEFRLASIVLSANRLLTSEEMAFFDLMAARGEARTPMRFATGFREGRTRPFYLATRKLATLSTEIP